MRPLACVYNSFLWGMALAVTLFGNQWLEMRVNMGCILAGSWAVLFVAAQLVCRIKKRRMTLLFTTINTAVCAGYGLLLLGPRRLCVVPAAMIREGMGLPRLRFTAINSFLIAGLAITLVILVIGEAWQARSRKNKR